jgi:hypothetical protein
MARYFALTKATLAVGLVLVATLALAVPQQESTVPPYIRFGGIVRRADGTPRSGVAGVTFALYEESEGGAPLWMETQNVALDEQGRYAVLLGSQTRGGVPLELFASGQTRWLGVRVENEPELPRVMLVSVPYALKAAEAEKLGGRGVSEFVLHEKLSQQIKDEVATAEKELAATTGTTTLAVTASGTVGQIAKFTGVDALGDSTITESGTNVGIGTITPPNKFAITSTTAILPSTMQISHPAGDWGLVFKRTANDSGYPNFTFLKTRGETAVPAQSGDGVGRIVWQAVNNAGSPAPVAVAEVNAVANTVSGANVSSSLRFYTKPLAGSMAERMVINQDGNVGIGTFFPPNRFAINSSTAVLPSTMQISHPAGDWGLVFKRTANDSGHPNFTFLKTRGETAVPAQAGDGMGRIVWQAVNGSSVPLYVGDISMFANAVTASDVSSDMRFATRSTTIGLGERMRITPEGRVGIGTFSPSDLLTVGGNVRITGGGNGLIFSDGSSLTTATTLGDITGVTAGTGLSGGATSGNASLSLSTAARTRGIVYIAGCDTCSALADTDDQKTIYQNVIGAMTIEEVKCFTDFTNGSTPSINLKRDDGTAENILSSDLVCSTTGANTTAFVMGENVLNLNDKLDFHVVSAGGTATRVTVVVKAVLN